MLKYIDEVVCPWINANPELHEEFLCCKEDVYSEGITDKFGLIARKRVFYSYLVDRPDLVHSYEEAVNQHYYVPDAWLVDQLEVIIRATSWKRVMMALRFVLRRLLKKEPTNTVNSRKMDKALLKLQEVPSSIVLNGNK